MKGLIVKDFALLRQAGSKILFFALVWGVVMTFVMDDISFTTGWVVLIAVIVSLSTLSYDEYDNCMPFLMSMPTSRRIYAAEKYVFSLLCGFIAWLCTLVIMIICSLAMGKGFPGAEDFLGSVMFLPVMMLVPAVTLPAQFKWGAQKGRNALFILFGVVFVAGFLIEKFGSGLAGAAAKLETLPMGGFVLGCMAAGVVITLASVFLSIRIMEKKEF